MDLLEPEVFEQIDKAGLDRSNCYGGHIALPRTGAGHYELAYDAY
jgi:hypothetical protein